MNLLPHVFVLNHIKSVMKDIQKNPYVVEFILSGLHKEGSAIAEVYGARYIDQAIKAFSEMDWHYCLGYRLDIARLPNISVMFEGGTENQQFIGDFGHYESKQVLPRMYGRFTADRVEDGSLVVRDKSVLSKIWRTQTVVAPDSNKSFTIVDLTELENEVFIKLNDSSVDSYEDGLIGWEIYGASSYEVLTIGESLDKVSVKVYVDLPGDPEMCEIVNCILRYILKQARLPLIDNGLNSPTLNYRPIARNESYPNQNVWSSELTVSGLLTDQWIIAKNMGSDHFGINMRAVSEREDNWPVVLS